MFLEKRKNLILLLVVIIFSFLLTEIVCRLILPNPLKPPKLLKIEPYKDNPYILKRRFAFFHIPHSQYFQFISEKTINYTINSFGFREREINRTPQKNIKRLLIIGDSIAEGHGVQVEDRFSDLLQNDIESLGWEIVNCSIQGGSPLYYALNINRYLGLNPNAVLIILFDNDLFDDRSIEYEYDEFRYLENPYLFKKDNLLNFIFKSRFIQLLYQILNTYCYPPPLGEVEKIIYRNKSDFQAKKEWEIIKDIKNNKWPDSKLIFNHQWQLSLPYLGYIVKIFKEKEIPLFIVKFTDKNPCGLDTCAWQYSHMQDTKITIWAKENNLPFLSFMPILRNYYKYHSPYGLGIPNDGHPTEKGHCLIAKFLKPWLIKNIKKVSNN